jgi:stage V sporulation protein SpoVS
VSCVDVEKVTGAEGLELASQENLLLADPPPGHLQLFEQDCLAETASGAQPALRTASSINTSTTKLKATSAEFYPKAYLAAAAAAAAATALAAASASTNGSSQQQQQHQSMADHHSLATAEDLDHGAPGGGWRPADDQHQSPAHQLCQADVTSEQQQQPGYLQHWRHWPQLQQITAVPVFFPVPVPVQPLMAPLTLMMYPYSYHQHQHLPPAPEQQYMHASAPLPGEDQQHPAVGPAAAAAPADMPPGRAAAGIGVAVLDDLATSSSPSVTHQASSLLDSSSGRYIAGSSRPGSSASSMASGYSSFRGSSGSGWQQQQQQTVLREASSTVSVSPLSNVKDAAGALAKVASRHGSCLLLAVARAGDQVAQVTHVAAKSLAVARFYLNSGMSAEGAAGVEAAAHLTGVEPAAAAVAPAAAVQDELIFMPYYKSGCNAAQGSSNEPVIHFLVAKAAAVDLPAQLPPPVGIPACMQDRQQQPGAAATAAASSSSSSQLLRAGAGTDVNKLSNAIIHNILDQGHVALQLAGATACLIAMKALVKAGSRLQKKFSSDIVATASFANLDTSSSIGRSTVFLRVDVMRSSLLRQLAVAGAAAGDALSRQVSAALEVVVGCSPHQHQQPLVAC